MRAWLPAALGIGLLLGISPAAAQSTFDRFITRSGDKLMDGPAELRFISFNIPNLHYIEDELPFAETNPWRLPDEFEIRDALEAVRRQGGTVVRTYVLSVRKADDPPGVPRHVVNPGEFDEACFRALDRVLQVANEKGVRVILPFVDNASWFGGIKEYAAFRGKPSADFWTDPEIIADFKKTVAYVIGRRNTLTGTAYRDDKTILAWETGNELKCPPAWTHEIATTLRSLDPNHLVADGFYASVLSDELVAEPATDLVSTHHYERKPEEMLGRIRESRAKARGKKPYFVGEFGFAPTPVMRDVTDLVIDEGVCGALVWSLRFRNRDGGFYWHSEPFGGNRYKAYHWPGFASGAAYDEAALLALLREKAYAIRGLKPPAVETPAPPVLLPVSDPAAVSWRGSAGAAGYDVERAPAPGGPWTSIGKNVSDADLPYRAPFSDPTAEPGTAYCYRVRAVNEAGASEPSNVVGPVTFPVAVLVDELQDLTRAVAAEGVTIETGEPRKAKEDFHRAKGREGGFLLYEVAKPIRSWSVCAFFPKEGADVRVLVSADGKAFKASSSEKTVHLPGQGESKAVYGYWKPVGCRGRDLPEGARFLKIEFAGEAQVGRVEVRYGGR